MRPSPGPRRPPGTSSTFSGPTRTRAPRSALNLSLASSSADPPMIALRDTVSSRLGTTAPQRRRIAMLLDHLNSFSGGYEAQLRDAIHAKCREAGHHLLLVYGGPVEAPQPPDAADNAIYALLRPDSADGVIVVSSLLSTYSGPGGVGRLVARLAHPMMCSIGIELAGVPSLVLDNRPGMEAVVEHLIRDHGRRKLAFLAGTPENPEATARFEAYQAVLNRHGIAVDPRRIARGLLPRQLGEGGDGGDFRERRGDRRRRRGQRRDGHRRHRSAAQAGPPRAPGRPRHRLRRSRSGAPRKPAADHCRAAVRRGRGLGGANDRGTAGGASGPSLHTDRRAARPPSIVRVRPHRAPPGFTRAAARTIPPPRSP